MPSHRDAPLSQSKRETFRQQVLADHGPVCKMARCLMSSRVIDLTLKDPNHPGYYTADHIVEVSRGGAPYDRRNGRPAHRLCNITQGCADGNRRRKPGRRRTQPPVLRTSRPW